MFKKSIESAPFSGSLIELIKNVIDLRNNFARDLRQFDSLGKYDRSYYTRDPYRSSHKLLQTMITMIEQGADVNERDNEAVPALLLAAKNKLPDFVEVLLKGGADMNVKDPDGKTIFDIAKAEWSIADIVARFTSDEIVFHSTVGGQPLKEVFNFVTMERFSLLREKKDGPTVVMLRDMFSDIQGHPQLQKALEEHTRRGGKVTERDMFSSPLANKLKP